ncbi:hypothetical protein FN846DRAFT_954389, partial [Sphaerosporella brunnea]
LSDFATWRSDLATTLPYYRSFTVFDCLKITVVGIVCIFLATASYVKMSMVARLARLARLACCSAPHMPFLTAPQGCASVSVTWMTGWVASSALHISSDFINVSDKESTILDRIGSVIDGGGNAIWLIYLVLYSVYYVVTYDE